MSIVEEREESLELQLAGHSNAATAEDAARAVEEADADAASAAYGVGFGYSNFHGSPRGMDGIQLGYVISDGTRRASIHIRVSGTTLATLRGERWIDAPDAELLAWVLDELHRKAGMITRSDDRYVRLVEAHPLSI
jgi:hypothetical protein